MEEDHPHKKRPVVIRTADHRLRVFVSSTLKELADERDVTSRKPPASARASQTA